MPYSHEGDEHRRAAERLATVMGWSGAWYGGGMPDGRGDCFVRAEMADGAPSFVIKEV